MKKEGNSSRKKKNEKKDINSIGICKTKARGFHHRRYKKENPELIQTKITSQFPYDDNNNNNNNNSNNGFMKSHDFMEGSDGQGGVRRFERVQHLQEKQHQLSHDLITNQFHNNYLSSNESIVSESILIERCKQISSYLSGVDQQIDRRGIIKRISTALINPNLISHFSNEVKLLIACSLADIIRIFAPDAPYNQSQLLDIFSLFLAQLCGLKENFKLLFNCSSNNNTENLDSFGRRTYLLERLYLVKAFVLADEIDHNLVINLLKIFFSQFDQMKATPNSSSSSASLSLRKEALSYMYEIIVSCLTEIDHLTPQLLDPILEHLVSPLKNVHSYSYEISCSLVVRCLNDIQQALQNLVAIVFAGQQISSRLGTREKIYELLIELNRISSPLLAFTIPHLLDEIRKSDHSCKLQFCKFLQQLFLDGGLPLTKMYAKLFSEFLSCFSDESSLIRSCLVDYTRKFALKHQSISEEMQSGLLNRIRDTDDKVRLFAIESACDIAQHNPLMLSTKFLHEIGDRMRDTKLVIRDAAMTGLSVLYNLWREKRRSNSEVNQLDDPDSKIAWIPQAIVKCYRFPINEDRMRIEKLLNTCLLPPASCHLERANALLRLTNELEELDKESFEDLLKSCNIFRELFLKYYKIRSSDNSAAILRVIGLLSSKITISNTQRSKDLFRKIHVLKDSRIFKILADFASGSTKIDECKADKEYLLKSVRAKSTLEKFMAVLIDRLSCRIVTEDVAEEVLNVFFDKVLGKGNTTKHDIISSNVYCGPIKPVFWLLRTLAPLEPQFFVPHIELIIEVLETSSALPEFAELCVFILSNCGSMTKLSDNLSKRLRKCLLRIFLDGRSIVQSKLALRSIVSFFGQENVVTGNHIENLVCELPTNVNTDLFEERTLTKTLNLLALIAKFLPFQYKRFSVRINELILNILLSFSHSRKSSNGKLTNLESVKIMKSCINLQKQFLFYAGKNNNPSSIFDAFFDILKNLKGVSKNELFLQCVAGSLIKLAYIYDSHISPLQFEMLVWSVQNASSAVRKDIAMKICKGLKTFRLPQRYLAFLALICVQTDAKKKQDNAEDIFAQLKSLMITSIAARRKFYSFKYEELRNKPDERENLNFKILPEYTVPYYVSLLAHSPVFLKDNKTYQSTNKHLSFFLDCLLQQEDNFSFLIQLLQFAKSTEDALYPNSDGIQLISNLALEILEQRSKHRNWTDRNLPRRLFLPPSLFRQISIVPERIETGKYGLDDNSQIFTSLKSPIHASEKKGKRLSFSGRRLFSPDEGIRTLDELSEEWESAPVEKI